MQCSTVCVIETTTCELKYHGYVGPKRVGLQNRTLLGFPRRHCGIVFVSVCHVWWWSNDNEPKPRPVYVPLALGPDHHHHRHRYQHHYFVIID